LCFIPFFSVNIFETSKDRIRAEKRLKKVAGRETSGWAAKKSSRIEDALRNFCRIFNARAFFHVIQTFHVRLLSLAPLARLKSGFSK
jgi:hypothetical protein